MISTPSTFDLVKYFLQLGTTGFGGPIALVGRMREDLVDGKGWFSPDEYQRGLALAQLAPGPLAAQLAAFFGWARGGALGAGVVGAAFVAPSLLMVLLIGWVYQRFQGIGLLQDFFWGANAVTIGIIAVGAYKLSRKTIKANRSLWVIAIINLIMTAYLERELVVALVASGVIYATKFVVPKGRRKSPFMVFAPWPLLSLVLTSEQWTVLSKLAWFFLKAGLVVFGSGLAIVPYLRGGVVHEMHWLTDRQFLDAVAIAMITPGPVVITVGFIGYLVAGFSGGLVAAAAVFVPCFLLVIILAPHFEKVIRNHYAARFVEGVTGAAVGALGGAVLVLGRRALIDGTSLALFGMTLILLLKLKKPLEPLLMLGGGLLGLALR